MSLHLQRQLRSCLRLRWPDTRLRLMRLRSKWKTGNNASHLSSEGRTWLSHDLLRAEIWATVTQATFWWGFVCLALELLTKPCFQSIKCLPLLAGRVLVCTIHEHSFTPRCFVESDSTDVAVRTAETQRRQTSLARPCLSHWDSVCPAQWDSLGDAATRAGMRLRHDVLAKAA